MCCACYWQVWTYGGEYSAVAGKAVKPELLHIYNRPAMIDNYERMQYGAMSRDDKAERHELSPEVREIDS